MFMNILIVILGGLIVAAGIFAWWLENCGEEVIPKKEEKEENEKKEKK